jgi:DNA invertase Pin-like site-specific DNA recombinase
MATVGYARVSSTGQSLDVQLAKLRDCDRLFQEKRTGTTAERPALKACLGYLREGDTLVITRLDRLARSTLHLTQIADQLKRKGVELRVLDQAIDTTTPTGRLMFNMLSAIAEFETEIRKERQLDGIEAAKGKGVAFGRKAKLTPAQVEAMKARRAAGALIKDLMREYGLSKASVYRLLGESTAEASAPVPEPEPYSYRRPSLEAPADPRCQGATREGARCRSATAVVVFALDGQGRRAEFGACKRHAREFRPHGSVMASRELERQSPG